jgi:ornithine carbamoyltransferase
VRHLLSLKEFTKREIEEIITLARTIKSRHTRGGRSSELEGTILAMIFEKSSTRTRVSFESGIYQLGGTSMFLSNRDIQLGRGEPMKDTARVITRMADMVVIRTSSHERLEEFAHYSHVPVINGLTDLYHPVQLITDYMTMLEHGKDDRSVVAFVGDGNNMAHSWIQLAVAMGIELRIATPKGYEPSPSILSEVAQKCQKSKAQIVLTDNPSDAVKNADVITTDVWASMGQEHEHTQRLKDFQRFKVDDTLMQQAKHDAIFLHCLPAHREEEVSESVLEGSQSVVFDEAENRLHAQKGIMVWLAQQLR